MCCAPVCAPCDDQMDDVPQNSFHKTQPPMRPLRTLTSDLVVDVCVCVCEATRQIFRQILMCLFACVCVWGREVCGHLCGVPNL